MPAICYPWHQTARLPTTSCDLVKACPCLLPSILFSDRFPGGRSFRPRERSARSMPGTPPIVAELCPSRRFDIEPYSPAAALLVPAPGAELEDFLSQTCCRAATSVGAALHGSNRGREHGRPLSLNTVFPVGGHLSPASRQSSLHYRVRRVGPPGGQATFTRIADRLGRSPAL
jgi:hypothetical protein